MVLSCLFVCLFEMIVQKELANNPFGHRDWHALPCPGLQQAEQGHFLQTFTSFRKCHFKDHVYVLTNPFWMVQYLV